MAASTTVIFSTILLAAGLLAAAPVLAQTNDPNLTEEDIECLRQQAAGRECAPAPNEPAANDQTPTEPAEDEPPPDAGGTVQPAEPAPPAQGDQTPANVTRSDAALPGAVALPKLIVDLFPNPTPRVAPEQPATTTADTASPPASPPPAGALGASPPVVAPLAVQGAFVPDEVLVTVEGDAAVAADIAAAFGLEIRSQRASTLLGSTVVRYGIPDGRPVGVVLAQLAGDGRATRPVPNSIYTLQQASGVASYAFQRIALSPEGASGENVRVGVIDTAIDETHPAIRDAISGEFDAMPGVEVATRDHATSVAGLIAGAGEFRGMAPGAKIYHARAFEGGRSTMDVILAALDWAAEQDVRIINMSFVGPKNELLQEACDAARTRDIVLVAAAGNNGPKAPFGYPAAYPGVIAVTATDDKDALMPQANRGAYIFVSAPGVNVLAPAGGGADLVTGTSFAAAVVSGAIANLIRAAPDRSADWIEAALSATAKDLGPTGRDSDFGYGLVDATAADSMGTE